MACAGEVPLLYLGHLQQEAPHTAEVQTAKRRIVQACCRCRHPYPVLRPDLCTPLEQAAEIRQCCEGLLRVALSLTRHSKNHVSLDEFQRHFVQGFVPLHMDAWYLLADGQRACFVASRNILHTYGFCTARRVIAACWLVESGNWRQCLTG